MHDIADQLSAMRLELLFENGGPADDCPNAQQHWLLLLAQLSVIEHQARIGALVHARELGDLAARR